MKYADELLRVAADRGGVPFAAPGARNAVFVQRSSDLDGRSSRGEIAHNAPHDLGLPLDDLEHTLHRQAVCTDPVHTLVAVCLSAGEAPGEHGGLHSAKGLPLQFGQEHRTE
ncbi:hypothetical protein [Sphingomonas sp. 3P27F8]|uniref:hypothetical protein n=1 Tax=Sphingomonas sp. 3P27F8 TaxID=2502213 RepID=UPI0010F4CA9F|nr:hypothetical protein [Sphingomonas sp. 3P27F8]